MACLIHTHSVIRAVSPCIYLSVFDGAWNFGGTSMNRIKSIEGLRGTFAFAVFNSYTIPALFPHVIDSAIWKALFCTPLFFLKTAGFGVGYFFFVSGFGLYLLEDKKSWWRIILTILKRYFRLVPTILMCNLFCWILMRKNFYYLDSGNHVYQLYDLQHTAGIKEK